MNIFSAKAYNIVALAPCAKATLTNETVDPFLRLVDDSKLQSLKPGPAYGSKEDDEDALRSLSEIETSESQSKESFATLIVKTLKISSDQASTMRQQLLHDFLPDDACPFGAQVCLETPLQIYQLNVQSNGAPDTAEPPLFTIEDEALLNASEGFGNNASSWKTINLGCYRYALHGMAGNCEALQMGKQKKLSTFMAAQQRAEIRS